MPRRIRASEMDADVKCGWWCGVLVCGHGGGCWDRAAGATAATTVTLRCAGRDRRTVSGRELPRTRVASRDRIEAVEGAPGCARRPPHPSGRSGSGSGGLLVAEGLVGHGGPEEAGELAGDGDGGDGRALAVVGEGVVAVVQAQLGAPGAGGDFGRHVGLAARAAGSVAVVPGGLDEQPAGVLVAGVGDVA